MNGQITPPNAIRVLVAIRQHRTDVDHPDEEGTIVHQQQFNSIDAADAWAKDALRRYRGPHFLCAFGTVEEWDTIDRTYYPTRQMNYTHGDDSIEWYRLPY